jgi:UDP-2-acetamido-3-amino-2,3-dideoxy-glucuronate N-acetyltransferase
VDYLDFGAEFIFATITQRQVERFMEILSLIDSVKVVQLPTFEDERGVLSVINGSTEIPFNISRVFFTYASPLGIVRGDHAHKKCYQFLVCLNKEIEVEVTDSRVTRIFTLDSPRFGLLVPPLLWTRQKHLSDHSVGLVIASEPYSEEEYIRNYEEYELLVSKK